VIRGRDCPVTAVSIKSWIHHWLFPLDRTEAARPTRHRRRLVGGHDSP